MSDRISKAVTVAAIVLASAVAGAAEPDGPKDDARRRWGAWSGRIALEQRYDDNILQLSAAEIDRFERDPTSSRFRIASPDDRITIARLDVEWTLRPLPRRETRLTFSADLYRYDRNPIKDWERYGATVVQELTASRRHLVRARAWFRRTPSFYLREITDDDASFDAGRRIRASEVYAQDEVGAAFDAELVTGRLRAIAGAERRDRDFASRFDERDGVRGETFVGTRLRSPSRARLDVAIDVSWGRYDARGDLPQTPIPDDDVSYRHRGTALEVAIPWGRGRHRGRAELGFERETREFTTANRFDLFHFGREDDRREWSLRLAQRFGPGLELVVQGVRRTNDARFSAGVDPGDGVSDYHERRVSLGLRWSWDAPPRRRSGASHAGPRR